MAKLTGFPTSLRYRVCTAVTLTAGAKAFSDTQLSLTNPDFEMTGGSICGGAVSVPQFLAGADMTLVRVRTTKGGFVKVTGSPDALEMNLINVILLRPDGGSGCLPSGSGCADGSQCCSDYCALNGICGDTSPL